jgi:hypothetical protein
MEGLDVGSPIAAAHFGIFAQHDLFIEIIATKGRHKSCSQYGT